MFGSKRTPGLSGLTDQAMETIIGKDTQVKGNVSANGTIRIDGQVEGEVSTKGDIIIGETGEVKAQIKARSATIAGTLHGNADVIDKLELAATGKIYGDIKTGVLIIGEGAIFKGACEMRHGSEAKDAKAAPAKS